MATGALPIPVHPAMAASPARMYTPYASRPFNSTIALTAWDHGLGAPFRRTSRRPSADFAVSRSTTLIINVSRRWTSLFPHVSRTAFFTGFGDESRIASHHTVDVSAEQRNGHGKTHCRHSSHLRGDEQHSA